MEVLETVLRTEQREHQKPVRLLLGGNRSRGRGTTGIALVLGGGLPQSSMTVRRYTKGAIAGLLNHTTNKPGTQPISEATQHEICAPVGNPPPPTATQWRVREIAKRTDVDNSTDSAILREGHSKPLLIPQVHYPMQSTRGGRCRIIYPAI